MSKEMAKKHTLDNFFPNVEIKDYSVMIDRKNVFDQPIRDDLRTYDDIRNITNG